MHVLRQHSELDLLLGSSFAALRLLKQLKKFPTTYLSLMKPAKETPSISPRKVTCCCNFLRCTFWKERMEIAFVYSEFREPSRRGQSPWWWFFSRTRCRTPTRCKGSFRAKSFNNKMSESFFLVRNKQYLCTVKEREILFLFHFLVNLFIIEVEDVARGLVPVQLGG